MHCSEKGHKEGARSYKPRPPSPSLSRNGAGDRGKSKSKLDSFPFWAHHLCIPRITPRLIQTAKQNSGAARAMFKAGTLVYSLPHQTTLSYSNQLGNPTSLLGLGNTNYKLNKSEAIFLPFLELAKICKKACQDFLDGTPAQPSVLTLLVPTWNVPASRPGGLLDRPDVSSLWAWH